MYCKREVLVLWQILAEVQNLQDATGVMKQSMEEMSTGARKINETGAALSEISQKMQESINMIGVKLISLKSNYPCLLHQL